MDYAVTGPLVQTRTPQGDTIMVAGLREIIGCFPISPLGPIEPDKFTSQKAQQAISDAWPSSQQGFC